MSRQFSLFVSRQISRVLLSGLLVVSLCGQVQAGKYCDLEAKIESAQQALIAAQQRLNKLGTNPAPSAATQAADKRVKQLQGTLKAKRDIRGKIEKDLLLRKKTLADYLAKIQKELDGLGQDAKSSKRRGELEAIKTTQEQTIATLDLQVKVLDAEIPMLVAQLTVENRTLTSLRQNDVRASSLWQLDRRSRTRAVNGANSALTKARAAFQNAVVLKDAALTAAQTKARLDTLKARRDTLKSKIRSDVNKRLRPKRSEWRKKIANVKTKSATRKKLLGLLNAYYKQIGQRDYQRRVVRAYAKKAKDLRTLSKSLTPFDCDCFADVKPFSDRLNLAAGQFTKWARSRNGKANQAASQAEQLGNQFNRLWRKVKRERFKPTKNEGKVSSRRVKITVSDSNSIIDDEYKLYVNGKFKGIVRNIQGGSTSFNIKLKSGRNQVELRLYKKRGKNTHLTIQISREFKRSFSGSRDHRWVIHAPTRA